MSTEQQLKSKEESAQHVNYPGGNGNGDGGALQNEDEVLMAGELANNDGSVVETLDTAFHDLPGYIKDHSLAGSNRADYYEARSDGKSDSEEENDYMRDHPVIPE